MPKVPVPNAGAVGVIMDLSQDKLPLNAWTEASNMRFLDGSCRQFLGHGPAYDDAIVEPLHILPVNTGSDTVWLYAGRKLIYAVSVATGEAVHTNITRQSGGVDEIFHAKPNNWTSTLLSGVPILNPGNEVDPPQQWNLDLGSRMTVLDNWPTGLFCKSMRAYKNFLIALNITRNGQSLPYMVKWSSAADPGAVPATWAVVDETQDAGEYDIATGGDRIIDGLELRDSFMVYKEQSVWRMDYVGGPFVFSFRKVLGISGAMNRNCIVELPDGLHFVLTGSDIVVHDGQTATPILDKVARRALFADMDVEYNDRAFVFKNPFFNEVFVCYASIGSEVPNKAVVWNYRDRTVTYREVPNLNHAAYGSVNNTISESWASDSDPWDSDLTAWNAPGFVPNLARVLMASSDKALLLLDSAVTFNGVTPTAFLERRGIAFGEDEFTKRVIAVRPRITGSPGGTVLVKIGGHMTDPEADPAYLSEVEFVIGETTTINCMVDYRFMAIRFEAGTASQWQLHSYDIEVQRGSKY